ncbi:MAG TPA: hypothetical protein VI485_19510 [Vicinamibacterales bacterium]|nr:hypothetical protein [Vicinamibacterales bacterium]
MNPRRLCVFLPTLFLTTAIVTSVAAQQHVPLTDQQITSQVEHRLTDQGIRGVSVSVRDRTVTLSGTTRRRRW